jgi:hypothetical protein
MRQPAIPLLHARGAHRIRPAVADVVPRAIRANPVPPGLVRLGSAVRARSVTLGLESVTDGSQHIVVSSEPVSTGRESIKLGPKSVPVQRQTLVVPPVVAGARFERPSLGPELIAARRQLTSVPRGCAPPRGRARTTLTLPVSVSTRVTVKFLPPQILAGREAVRRAPVAITRPPLVASRLRAIETTVPSRTSRIGVLREAAVPSSSTTLIPRVRTGPVSVPAARVWSPFRARRELALA